ncbi:MAG TPA: SH3 domain-containing protein [Pseudonocardiaceae bacterium]
MSKRMLLVIGVLIVVVVVFIIQGKNNPNGNSSNTSNTTSNSTGQCQMKVTADVLNIRSSPDANGTVVGKLQNGQVTSAQKTVQNGYRQLNTNQWVSAQFVTAVSGSC